ncbi:MAG: Crp/Fnr family transcriptional regulator [Velocimicrobium sp.]
MEKQEFFDQTLPFWNKLSKEQQQQFLDKSLLKTFQTGETMHAEHKNCSGLFLIKTGQVRAFIVSETGKEITLYRLLEGDLCIFSASCMLKNINFDVFVEAEKETSSYLIPTKEFEKISKECMPVLEYTNELLASRFSDVMWIMDQVVFQSFDKRLANFILDQASMEGTETFSITQEKIARHLGSAREVVSRMMKYFVEEGMISLTRGKITIVNYDKLIQIVGLK